jgi:adenylate cyclase
MTESDFDVSLLIADISGSTALYDSVGNESAFRIVGECLENLRSALRSEDGMFVRSKGDDVLGAFDNASNALKAARDMLSQQTDSPLAIHVGIHFGHVINLDADVYGDTVNLTARLASLAKPGEILASETFVNQLLEHEKRWFQPLDNITFKGKSSPTSVYTLLEQDEATRTRFIRSKASTDAAQKPKKHTTLDLTYKDAVNTCAEGESLLIGRASECNLVIAKPWISRKHARVNFRRGRIELEDLSSSGTFVLTHDGYEIFLHRDSVLLTGSGTISPAVKADTSEAEIIHYQVH